MNFLLRGLVGILTFAAISAFAKDLVEDFNPYVLLAKTKAWSAERLMRKGSIRLRFKRTTDRGTETEIYVPSTPSTILVSTELVTWNDKNYLLTFWQEGVSTTAIRVFDPAAKGKTVLLERYSLGDVGAKVTPTGLTLRLAEPSEYPLEPHERIEKWSVP